MKIWLVNHYAVPPSMPGLTRSFHLSRQLVNKGHSVTLITCSFHRTLFKDVVLEPGENFKVEMNDGVQFVWLRGTEYYGNSVGRILNMISFAWRVWRQMGLRDLDGPDVIVASSPDLFSALAAQRLALHYKVPFVLEIRDLWPESLIEVGGMSRWHPLVLVLSQIEQYLYRKADRIISVLPTAHRYIQTRGALLKNIAWIPNGVSLELLPPIKMPDDNGTFTVMYAGSHGIANALQSVLEAVNILHNQGWQDRVRFHFIGDGPEKPALQAYVASHKLENVTFSESMPQTELYNVLREADAFVVNGPKLSLYKWGMSLNKLFDYLAMARPILFAFEAQPDPIQQAQAGFSLPPEDAPAMAEAIKQLFSLSPEERWKMGQRGRQHVEAQYSYRVLGERFAALLMSLKPDAQI